MSGNGCGTGSVIRMGTAIGKGFGKDSVMRKDSVFGKGTGKGKGASAEW